MKRLLALSAAALLVAGAAFVAAPRAAESSPESVVRPVDPSSSPLTTRSRRALDGQPTDDDDTVVLVSGLVEIGLGAALLAWGRGRVTVGFVVAAFFVAIFPGNLAQYVEGNDAFGLDTDQKRLMRLFFQPVLVAWVLWATAAWRDRPRRR